MTSKLMIQVSRQQLEYWMVMLRNGLPETVSSMIQTVLEAPEAPRQSGCCCPPKGHTGICAAAMCPVHHGLRALVDKNKAATLPPLSPDHSGGAGVVVLPERECEDCFQNDQSEQAVGFNRAIDKVKELNQ